MAAIFVIKEIKFVTRSWQQLLNHTKFNKILSSVYLPATTRFHLRPNCFWTCPHFKAMIPKIWVAKCQKMGRTEVKQTYVYNKIHCFIVNWPHCHCLSVAYNYLEKSRLLTLKKSSIQSSSFFVIKYAVWVLGREMFTILKLGSCSKKFESCWFKVSWLS